jgi:CDP-diacylglycerol--serine O-phosphatidyltransferase
MGMICDGLDGSAARLTRTMSRMGAELDSLADVVTFGIAPAIIACRLVGVDVPFFSPEWGNILHKAVFGAAAVYASCAALRLARYNVEDASAEAHGGFTGLPSPGAAGAMIGLVILYEAFGPQRYHGEQSEMVRGVIAAAVVAALLLLGLAMVSRLSYTHMVNRAFRGKAKIVRLVMVLALVWALVVKLDYVLPACFLGYALSGPVLAVVRRLRPARI